MTWEALEDRPLAWCLTISGVSDRYWSGAAPGAELHGGVVTGTDLAYRDVKALLSVGPISGRIDEVGGVASQAPVEVRLLAGEADYVGRGSADLVAPSATLRRIGPRGARKRTRLARTIPHALAVVDLEVDDDVSTWEVPCLLHVGQESLWATGTAGDGSGGDPYRFTACGRAVARTQVQAHVRDSRRGQHPYVTADAVAWQARRAEIHVSALGPDGHALGWEQYWRGILDSEPDMAGGVLTLRIAPLTSMLSWELSIGGATSVAASTTFLPDWHYLTPDAARELVLQYEAPRGAIMSTSVQFAAMDEASPEAIAVNPHPRRCLKRSVDLSLDPDHPRGGMLLGTRWGDVPDADSHRDVPLSLPGDTGILVAVASELVGDDHLQTPLARETTRLRLLDQDDDGPGACLRWWEHVQKIAHLGVDWQLDWGPAERWTVDTVEGVGGRWVSAQIGHDADGWELRGRALADPENPPIRVNAAIGGEIVCWVGVCLLPAGHLQTIRSGEAPAYGSYLALEVQTRAIDSWDTAEIVGVPEAWYQPGERFLGVLADDIYAGGVATQWVRVQGQDTDVRLAVSASQLVQDENGADVGYTLTIDPTVEGGRGAAILQMPGDAPFTVTPIARSTGTTATAFLLQLLLSGGGRGTNGPHDVQPYGCNLGESEVDATSFGAIALPDVLQDQTWEAVTGKSIAAQMQPILALAGAQVVQRWDATTRTWVVALVTLGRGSASDVEADVLDGEILTDGRPRLLTDGRVVRRYELSINFPLGDGDPTKVTFVDGDAAAECGGNMGEPLALELRGVQVDGGAGDALQALLPGLSGIRSRLGHTRPRWAFSTWATRADLCTLGLGSRIRLTARDACDIGGTTGVVSRVCQVLSVTRDHQRNRLALEVVPRDGDGAGWAPAMRVASVVDELTVTVEVDAASADDVGFFRVGLPAVCVPRGDWASAVSTTIEAIDGQGVTFAAAHGLAVGDAIRPAAHDALPDDWHAWAALADDDERLGDDVAQVIA